MLPNVVFVDDKAMASLVCPQCGNRKRVSLSLLKRRNKRNLKVRCTCLSRFDVSLEFRSYHRKKTNLEGSYEVLSDSGRNGKIQVINLSMVGIGFITWNSKALSVGDRVKLKFTLDNKKQSVVEKEAVVRHVRGTHVGSEFADTDQIDSDLAFYLMP